MAAGNRVRRHEADIVPVFRVGRAGIAETCNDKHGRSPGREGPVPAGGPAASAQRALPSRLLRTSIAEEPAIVAMVKSRSVIVGREFAGSVTCEMWIESPMSAPVEVDRR